MEYISVREASEKWGISVRRVQYLCSHDKIPGAAWLGKALAIPKSADKPRDGRYRAAGKKLGDACHSFQLPSLNGELFQSIVQFFPYPIQVYTPDGTVIYTNEAFLKVFKIQDKDKINGRYNLLKDSAVDKFGIKESLLSAIQGETVHIKDFIVPAQDCIDRFSDGALRFERIFMNVTVFPIHTRNKITGIAAVFVTSRLYRDREEIMKCKEYIENHWLEEFNIDDVASAVNLSKYYLARLFKKHIGITPYGYYQDIKIGRLKEALHDRNTSVSQAFANCGLDYNGNFARVFRQMVGMTPSQYKTAVLKK